MFINASNCSYNYRPIQAAIVFDVNIAENGEKNQVTIIKSGLFDWTTEEVAAWVDREANAELLAEEKKAEDKAIQEAEERAKKEAEEKTEKKADIDRTNAGPKVLDLVWTHKVQELLKAMNGNRLLELANSELSSAAGSGKLYTSIHMQNKLILAIRALEASLF